MTHQIFIAYRHDDGGHAGRMYDHLTREFSESAVYFDVEDLVPGTRYRTALDKAIRAARVCLAVIGQHWLSPKNLKRLHQPDDVACGEICAALECVAKDNGYALLPVLAGGAKMPKPEKLPAAIADFAEIEAHHLEDRRYYLSMGELVDLLVTKCGLQRMLGTGNGNIVIERRIASISAELANMSQQLHTDSVTGVKST